MCFIVNPTIQLNTVQHNVNHTRKVRFVMLKGKSCTYKKYITDTSCARSSYGYTYGAYMRNLGWSLTECHELPKHILRRTWVKRTHSRVLWVPASHLICTIIISSVKIPWWKWKVVFMCDSVSISSIFIFRRVLKKCQILMNTVRCW